MQEDRNRSRWNTGAGGFSSYRDSFGQHHTNLHEAGTHAGMLVGLPVCSPGCSTALSPGPTGVSQQKSFRMKHRQAPALPQSTQKTYVEMLPLQQESEARNESFLPDTSVLVFYLFIHFWGKYFGPVQHPRAARHLEVFWHPNEFPPHHPHLCSSISLPKLHWSQMPTW